jgi:signal transduction histidine kinase
MRLSDFILGEMDAIVAQWQAFAATRLPAAASMTPLALRDHAREILEAVASDLRSSQTREAQSAKSKGEAPVLSDAPETAAQSHAVLRAKSGFDINQLASEYRALRASILRLWFDACGSNDTHMDDVIRFNEAIDQALAESISFFDTQVEQSRNLFLGMLGHDMRSPLQIILLTADQLGRLNAGAEVSEAASLLINSGSRMRGLLDDLVEFNRLKLGVGMQISPTRCDLATVFAAELQQLRAAHPDCRLELKVTGDVSGAFDSRRVQRLLDNLVVNAIKYGARNAPVRVILTGQGSDVRFDVTNANGGDAIDSSTLEELFDPLKRGAGSASTAHNDGSVGLGLYIAREVVKAHGGDIAARSDSKETVFSVRLPRSQRQD